MVRPIKYRHPRTRLHTRILATVYTDLHRAAQSEKRAVGEIVEESVQQWLMASGYLAYRPDLPLNEIQDLLSGLPEHPHAKSLMEVFAEWDRDGVPYD